MWPEKATPARAGFPAENKSSGKSWIPRFSASSYLGITYSTYINTRHGVTARLRVNPVAQRELHVDQSMLACLVASRGLSSSSALLASVARYFGPFTTSGFTASKAALSSYTLGTTPASSDC